MDGGSRERKKEIKRGGEDSTEGGQKEERKRGCENYERESLLGCELSTLKSNTG